MENIKHLRLICRDIRSWHGEAPKLERIDFNMRKFYSDKKRQEIYDYLKDYLTIFEGKRPDLLVGLTHLNTYSVMRLLKKLPDLQIDYIDILDSKEAFNPYRINTEWWESSDYLDNLIPFRFSYKELYPEDDMFYSIMPCW